MQLDFFFKGYPTKPFVINVTTEPGNILSVYIKLQPVYPEPNCSAIFNVRIYIVHDTVFVKNMCLSYIYVHCT